MTKTKLGLALVGLAATPLSALAATPPDFEIKGVLQTGFSYFEGAHNDQAKGSEWEIRRARIGLKHESKKGWEAEFEIDIDDDNNEVSITDGYVRYTKWPHANFTFGKMKEPFGLENTTGSKSINTAERSIVTESFKPGRNYGLLVSRYSDRYTFDLGGFRTSEDEDGLDGYALTTRLTYNPLLTETSLIHLGFSGSQRDMQGNQHRINESLEVDAAGSIIEGRRINADKISQYSLEGAAVFGRASLQAEWMEQKIEEQTTGDPIPDTTYSGYYVLASFFLTQDSRSYKKGSFSSVKPTGEAGAWELVARYSQIELADIDRNLQADTLMVGVNYYATGRVKLMLNLAESDVDSPKEIESGKGRSAIFRAQYEF
jgi:phosphate-selective porin OprO/OprP